MRKAIGMTELNEKNIVHEREHVKYFRRSNLN